MLPWGEQGNARRSCLAPGQQRSPRGGHGRTRRAAVHGGHPARPDAAPGPQRSHPIREGGQASMAIPTGMCTGSFGGATMPPGAAASSAMHTRLTTRIQMPELHTGSGAQHAGLHAMPGRCASTSWAVCSSAARPRNPSTRALPPCPRRRLPHAGAASQCTGPPPAGRAGRAGKSLRPRHTAWCDPSARRLIDAICFYSYGAYWISV